MVSLPTPFRAFLGLAALVADEARHLPDRALELPMLAVSTALQMSLRAQQRYAALTARGDAVLSARKIGDEPPESARFEDDVVLPGPGALDDDVELAVTVAELVDEVDAGTPPSTLTVVDEPADAADPTAADEAGLFGAELTQPAADGLDEADEATLGTDSEKPEPSAERPARAPRKRSGKTVRAPRNARPSRFDVVSDE
jgi:hypothetical protein